MPRTFDVADARKGAALRMAEQRRQKRLLGNLHRPAVGPRDILCVLILAD